MTHQAKIVLRLLPVAAVLLLAAGCGKSEPPVFHLNMIAINQCRSLLSSSKSWPTCWKRSTVHRTIRLCCRTRAWTWPS